MPGIAHWKWLRPQPLPTNFSVFSLPGVEQHQLALDLDQGLAQAAHRA
jgi:hypothetical protein